MGFQNYSTIDSTLEYFRNLLKSIIWLKKLPLLIVKVSKVWRERVPLIVMTLHRWGEITQSFKFKYFYKSYCKSNELPVKGYHIIYRPQQLVEFAVTPVKKINLTGFLMASRSPGRVSIGIEYRPNTDRYRYFF